MNQSSTAAWLYASFYGLAKAGINGLTQQLELGGMNIRVNAVAPGLSVSDRRLLLTGLLIGQGKLDVAEIQIDAALRVGELDADQLREIVIFLSHYAGWPTGAALNLQVEKIIAGQKAAKRDKPS